MNTWKDWVAAGCNQNQRVKRDTDAETVSFPESMEKEIEIFRKFGLYSGYRFFILKKD